MKTVRIAFEVLGRIGPNAELIARDNSGERTRASDNQVNIQ
jgi:hypothetical protein